MTEFKVTREEAESIGWNSGNPGENPGSCEIFHQGFMILSVLMDIRDMLMPKKALVEKFDPKKFPNDLGPCAVEFCTDKAALVVFKREDLGKLFVPFSRMAPGVAEACVEGVEFKEFFLGNWMYDRLKDQAEENCDLGRSPDDRSEAPGPGYDDDIPF